MTRKIFWINFTIRKHDYLYLFCANWSKYHNADWHVTAHEGTRNASIDEDVDDCTDLKEDKYTNVDRFTCANVRRFANMWFFRL